jgi:phosphate starvation-inducible PhoH-like protein
VLENIPDIAICRLTASDVVRHALVQSIVAAYDKYENAKVQPEKKTPVKNYRKR